MIFHHIQQYTAFWRAKLNGLWDRILEYLVKRVATVPDEPSSQAMRLLIPKV